MSKKKQKTRKIFGVTAATILITFIGLSITANKKRKESVYIDEPEQINPFEGKKVIFIKNENETENADGVKGHLEAIGDSVYQQSFYTKYIKRALDILLSFSGLILLSPVMGIIAFAIKVEDPGPVLFTQKRLGQNKQYFKLHKFRSMRMNTPHDVPTHQLENPEQYITKVGKFIRAHSLDELPQIWDIFIGNMSIIGPRPGLWNQDLLTAERDKYGANNIKPGLTGLAQINGRDELEISDKAKLDGDYCNKIGLRIDAKIFLSSLHVFRKDDSVVEGGTGEIKKKTNEPKYTEGRSIEDLIGNIGFNESVEIDTESKKSILITGAGSYIGESFKKYASQRYPCLKIDTIDLLDENWRNQDFSKYDIIFHVAGLAHTDVGDVDEQTKAKYYTVNTDLTIEVCAKAKSDNVNRFIFMSSMIVYGDSAPLGKRKVIDSHTIPKAANFYGDSKLQADVAIRDFADNNFKVIVLRPPMIYGSGSKGNYPILAKIAKKLPIFPNVNNERSMLHIDNLCEFLCQIMMIKEFTEESVVLIPQNTEWTKTSNMVKEIAKANGKKVILVGGLARLVITIAGRLPGKIGVLTNKAFGNLVYSHDVSNYPGIDYQKVSFDESIMKTEGEEIIDKNNQTHISKNRKHILVVSQYFYPESFRVNDMCQEWIKRGYKVSVVTGIPNYPMGKTFDGYGLKKKRYEVWNGIEIYRIPLIPRGSSTIGMLMNYVSFMVSGILAGKIKNIKADYVFSFEVSPMTQVLTGISFAKKLHVPHYLYVQDLWPENVITVTGLSNPIVIKAIDKMVDYVYQNSDEIFATSPSFVKAICNRKIPVSSEKVHYWPQYAEEFYHPCEKKKINEIPDDNSFKIIFTGNIGKAQGLQILPATAELLKDENVKFIMVGDGRYLKEFKYEINKYGVENKFIMIPRQPAERVPELLSTCDAAFLSFQNDPLWEKTIPAKLQSYMACGMPIIAAAKGETARIIEEANCGVCCPIDDAEKLSMVIKEMKNMNLDILRKNSRNYFCDNFDKKKLMDQMESYFNIL